LINHGGIPRGGAVGQTEDGKRVTLFPLPIAGQSDAMTSPISHDTASTAVNQPDIDAEVEAP